MKAVCDRIHCQSKMIIYYLSMTPLSLHVKSQIPLKSLLLCEKQLPQFSFAMLTHHKLLLSQIRPGSRWTKTFSSSHVTSNPLTPRPAADSHQQQHPPAIPLLPLTNSSTPTVNSSILPRTSPDAVEPTAACV